MNEREAYGCDQVSKCIYVSFHPLAAWKFRSNEKQNYEMKIYNTHTYTHFINEVERLVRLLFIPKSLMPSYLLYNIRRDSELCINAGCVCVNICFRTHAHPSNMYPHFALIDQNSNYMESLSGQSWAAVWCFCLFTWFSINFTIELFILSFARSFSLCFSFRQELICTWMIFSCLFIVLFVIVRSRTHRHTHALTL